MNTHIEYHIYVTYHLDYLYIFYMINNNKSHLGHLQSAFRFREFHTQFHLHLSFAHLISFFLLLLCLWGVLHTFALSSANAKTPSLNELGVRCKKVLDTNVKGIGQQKGGKREREREAKIKDFRNSAKLLC